MEYMGGLRTKATHMPSGMAFITDAPKDNEGLGESFSPTDLLATSLLTCIITIIGIKMKKGELPSDLEVKGKVIKKMVSNPRRVGELDVNLEVFGDLSEEQKELIREASKNCPVCLSLHPQVRVNIAFEFKKKS